MKTGRGRGRDDRTEERLDRQTEHLIRRILDLERNRLRCAYCSSSSSSSSNSSSNLSERAEAILAEMEQSKSYSWKCPSCGKENIFLGWAWYEAAGSWHDIARLMRAGLVRITYRSSSSTCYMLNRSALKTILIDSDNGSDTDTDTDQYHYDDTIPPIEELFGDILGYDDLKRTIYSMLKNDSRVHILFIGPPASAKTLFLLALSRLPGAYFVSGSSTSKAGLLELLFSNDVKYLLIDELSELSKADEAVLYSLMQNGFITETKYGRHRKKESDTIVFATSNSTKRIATPLLSRFLVVTLQPYTYEEYVRIGRYMLHSSETENRSKSETSTSSIQPSAPAAEPETLNRLFHTLWYELRLYDVRIFDKIRGLLRAGLTIDDILNLLRRYHGQQ